MALASVMVGLVLLAACGSEDVQRGTASEALEEVAALDLSPEETVEHLAERAREEGEVLLYGSSNAALLEAWAERFEADYPDIDLEFVRLPPTELEERILAEARAGRHLVDVVDVNAVVGTALRDEGLLADHHQVPIPADFPSAYTGGWHATTQLMPNVMAWNTDAVEADEVPTSWEDFLDPAHAGCWLNVDPRTFVTMLVVERGQDGAESWLRGFLDNGGRVAESHSGMTRSLAAGEYDCAVYLFDYDVEGLIVEDDAPLAWEPADPTPANSINAHLADEAANPHAAALLMHWLLDPDGGAAVVRDEGRLAPHPDVEPLRERMRPWVVDGSELAELLLPIGPELAAEHGEQVTELIEEYLVPGVAAGD